MMKKMRRGMYIYKHRLIYKIDEYDSIKRKRDAKSISRKIKLKKEFSEFYKEYRQTPCFHGCKTGHTETCRGWCYLYRIWKLGKRSYEGGI